MKKMIVFLVLSLLLTTTNVFGQDTIITPHRGGGDIIRIVGENQRSRTITTTTRARANSEKTDETSTTRKITTPTATNTTSPAFVSQGEPSIIKPTNKGNFFLNANSSNFGLSTGSDVTQFNLNTNFGYFVANRFALLGGVGFDMVSVSGNTANVLSINAGLRYYLIEADKGGLFINSSLYVIKPYNFKAQFALNIGAGYSFFLNNRVAFEPIVSFVMPFSEGSSNAFILGGGFSIFF
jgi:hypothetical protein